MGTSPTKIVTKPIKNSKKVATTDILCDAPTRTKALTTPCSKNAMISAAKAGPKYSPTVAVKIIKKANITAKRTASSLLKYRPNHLSKIFFITLLTGITTRFSDLAIFLESNRGV